MYPDVEEGVDEDHEIKTKGFGSVLVHSTGELEIDGFTIKLLQGRC